MDVKATSNQLATPATTPEHTAVTSPNTSGVKFAQALGGAVTVAGQMAAKVSGAGGLGGGALSSVVGGGASVNGGVSAGAGDDSGAQLNDLIQQQEAIQLQSEQFTSITNISKEEHDTKMSAIRNLSGG